MFFCILASEADRVFQCNSSLALSNKCDTLSIERRYPASKYPIGLLREFLIYKLAIAYALIKLSRCELNIHLIMLHRDFGRWKKVEDFQSFNEICGSTFSKSSSNLDTNS